jgi:hypothetical protein
MRCLQESFMRYGPLKAYHPEPLITCEARGCGDNEQDAGLKRYCHPSRELFRAGDLLFFSLYRAAKNSRSPAPLSDFRVASCIAAERGMTINLVVDSIN